MSQRDAEGGIAVTEAYRELTDLLRRRSFPPGSRLPGERELSTRIGVSRSTLRKALDLLEDKGLVDRSPKRGWFVPPNVVGEPPSTLQSFSEMARARGLVPGAKVLSARKRQATFEEAGRLRIAPAASVLELSRLRTLDGVPICVDVSIVVLARVPALAHADMTDRSLYETIEELSDVQIDRSSYTLRADACDQFLADLLEVPTGAPILIGEELTYLTDGTPILAGTMSYRADAYRFQADLFRRALGASPPEEIDHTSQSSYGSMAYLVSITRRAGVVHEGEANGVRRSRGGGARTRRADRGRDIGGGTRAALSPRLPERP
jgi:GntR family transcriptional regulator